MLGSTGKPKYRIVKYLNKFSIEKYIYGLDVSSLWNWHDNPKNWAPILYKAKNGLCTIEHGSIEDAERELERISTDPVYYYR